VTRFWLTPLSQRPIFGRSGF